MNTFSITAINIESIFGKFRQNMENHFKWIDKNKDSHFILFPELSLSGYTTNNAELNTCKEKINSALNDFCIRTKNYPEISLAVGCPLFIKGKIYIAQHLIKNGQILYSHLKRILGPGEANCFSVGGISKVAVDYEIYPECRIGIGIQICAESHSPESSARLADNGAGLLLMPFASPRETGAAKLERLKKYLPARSYDNSCFLVCCNLIREGQKTGRAPAVSMIIGPRGDVLSEAAGPDESSCTAEISLIDIQKIKKSSMGWFRSWPHIRA